MPGTVGQNIHGSVQTLAEIDEDLRRARVDVVAAYLRGFAERHEDAALLVARNSDTTEVDRNATVENLGLPRRTMDAHELAVLEVREVVTRYE